MSKLSFIPQSIWATMRGLWAAEALSSKRMLRYSCNNSMQLFAPQLWKKELKRWKCFRAIQYYIWLAQRVSWWHVLLCMLDHPCPRHCIPAFQPALYHELRPSLWTDCGWRFIALGVLCGLTMMISRWMNLILLRRVFKPSKPRHVWQNLPRRPVGLGGLGFMLVAAPCPASRGRSAELCRPLVWDWRKAMLAGLGVCAQLEW